MPRFAEVEKIKIVNRQRQTPMSKDKLAELKDSIRERGLLHPIIVVRSGDDVELVAGERRLTACKELIEEGFVITHDQWNAPKGSVPITLLNLDTPYQRAAAELEENFNREDLHWTDQDRALALIHELKEKENPAQTISATANDLMNSTMARVPGINTAETLRRRIGKALVVAKHLDDPEIAKARNTNEAFAKIAQRAENRAMALLRAKTKEEITSSGLPPVDLRLGDAFEIMPLMEAEQFDLVLCDPPYGIDAHTGGFRSRSPLAHEYNDTLKHAQKFLQDLLLEAFRLTKPRANIFIFTDVQNWQILQETSARLGWVPFRTQIIWVKSQTEGQAPWGGSGFTRAHEVIFYATKGQKGLHYSIPDVIYARRVLRSKKIFAAQKPHELLQQLIAASTLPGDHVFDPCAGSGSSLRSARLLGRKATGIELNENTYHAAMNFVHSEKEDSDDDSSAQPNLSEL